MVTARRGQPGAGGYATVAALTGLAVLVTPYGTDILAYYPRILNDPALHSIQEWQHSWPTLINMPFYVTFLVIGGFAFVARRRGKATGPLVLWIVAFALTAMAFYAVRNQVWFGFVAGLVGAQCVTALWPKFGRTGPPADRRMIGAVIALVAAATLAVVVVVATTPAAKVDSSVSMPTIKATDAYMAAHPATRVLADDITGTELLWRYPRLGGRVAFDARTEIYKPASIHTLARFLSGRKAGWKQAMVGYNVIAISCQWHADVCHSVSSCPAGGGCRARRAGS